MPFERLIEIVEALRGPDGCPWDKEQTRQSLKPFLIEEAYELLEALDENDPEKIKEELGDLLFQIVFHCRLSEEMKQFDAEGVIDGIAKKMIGRHPHVFGDDKLKTSREVLLKWDEHKKKEGKLRESLLEGVPKTLPSLLMAHKLQHKASKAGFDWDNVDDVFKKLDEELQEFKDAVSKKTRDEIEDELGDIFFVLVRVSHFVGVNPEDALRKTISKFIHRFRHMEMRAAETGKKLSDMTLAEMDVLWEEAKKLPYLY